MHEKLETEPTGRQLDLPGESITDTPEESALVPVSDSARKLSERQAKVLAILSTQSNPKLRFDQWYLAALDSLETEGPDFLAQAAHSIREITDNFPRQFGVPFFQSPVPPTKDAVRELIDLRDRDFNDGWRDQLITPALARILDRLTKLRSLFTAPPRNAGFRLALEQRDPLAGQLSGELRQQRDKEFAQCYQFFQDAAHHNTLPDKDLFLEHLRLYESLLISYLSPVTAAEQETILRIIRANPTPESTEQLRELITHNSSSYTLLLTRLENESWLPILRDFKLFDDLPEPEALEGGGYRYPHHIPLSCLARLAPKAPELTIEILEGLPASKNPQILDQITRCIAHLDKADLVPRAYEILKRVIQSPDYSGYLWLREILSSWTSLGYHEEPLNIIRLFLRQAMTGPTPSFSDRSKWELQEIDERCLPALTALNPSKAAKTLFYALKDWAELQRQQKPGPRLLEDLIEDSEIDPAETPSTYWLEDFESGPSYGSEHEGIVAMRLFAVGFTVFESGNTTAIVELDQLLRSDSWNLFRNLRWQLYSQFPDASIEFARGDALACLPTLNLAKCSLGLSQFRMFEAHAKHHGRSFLTADETIALFTSVMEGPLDESGPRSFINQREILA